MGVSTQYVIEYSWNMFVLRDLQGLYRVLIIYPLLSSSVIVIILFLSCKQTQPKSIDSRKFVSGLASISFCSTRRTLFCSFFQEFRMAFQKMSTGIQSFVQTTILMKYHSHWKQQQISYTLIKPGSRQGAGGTEVCGLFPSPSGNNTSFHRKICNTFLLHLLPEIAFPPAGYSIFLGDFFLLAALLLLTFISCHKGENSVIWNFIEQYWVCVMKWKKTKRTTGSVSLNVLWGVLQRSDPNEKSNCLPSTHCHLLNKHLIKCAQS